MPPTFLCTQPIRYFFGYSKYNCPLPGIHPQRLPRIQNYHGFFLIREFVISRTGHHADGTKMWRMSYEVDTKTNSIRHVAPPDSMLPTGTTASSFLAEQERLRESQQTSSTTPVHAFICPVSTGIGDNDLLPYSAESGDVRCRVSKPDGLISPKPRQTGTRSCIA